MFYFFTGCFAHIDEVILNLFNNTENADHTVSVNITAPHTDMSLIQKNLFLVERLKSPDADVRRFGNFAIFNETEETGNNTLDEKYVASLPATIKKFLEKYASKNPYNKNPGVNNQQDIKSDSGNSGSSSGKDSDNAGSNSQGNKQTVIAESFELQLLNLINTTRKSKNLAGLNYNGTLNNIAQSRSADMLSRGYFSHTTPEGKNIFIILQEKGVGYSVAGENIYYANPPSSASAEKAFSVWMGSTMHRANIMGANYSQIGIGIAANNEKLVITLIFVN